MKILALLLISAAVVQAAPSTDLGGEIQVPLETSNAFALINKASGEVRLVTPGGGGDYTSTTYQTGLTGVTGATSGFVSGGDEMLVIASPTSNRLVRFNTSSGIATPLFPEHPAPQFPVYVRKLAGANQRLFLSHTMGGLSDAFASYSDPSGAFALDDRNTSPVEVTSFQPFYNSPPDTRFAAGVWKDGSKNVLFVYEYDGFVDVKEVDLVADQTVITTNVWREDGVPVIVGHVFGDNKISLFSMSTMPVVDDLNEVLAPFPIGSISPAPAVAGAPRGLLITSVDGQNAWHMAITDPDQLDVVGKFIPAPNTDISGLVPVPGHGIMLLSSGGNGLVDRFDRITWNGSEWKSQQTSFLAGLGGAAIPDFATLFWFDAEPMVSPGAKLLKMEVNPDWTSKASPDPIPSKFYTEAYIDSQSGLKNPILYSSSPPSGANYLMTNQLMDSVSLSAMDSTLALTLPPLEVTPASGAYSSPVLLDASSSEDEYVIFFRNATTGTAWSQFSSPITVSYGSTWQFYASKPSSGVNGPIITREFTFDVGILTGLDSDGDSVPDFVERANGLNPKGGVDSDADGYSDLDELINGSDPSNPSSVPASPTSPFNGQGFKVLAQAQNDSGDVASDGDPTQPAVLTDGVPLFLRGMTANLLSSSPTEVLSAPTALSGQLAARLMVKNPVPAREWLVLNTPQYFDINGGNPETRSGREMYKVIQRPVQDPPVINPTLTGTDINADATAWVAAASAAYGTYTQVSSLTTIYPTDTATAVLLEASLYNALLNLTPSQQASVGVPQNQGVTMGYDLFTLFAERPTDTSRAGFSSDMRDALLMSGLSFPNLLSSLSNVTSTSPDLLALTKELYIFHVSHSNPTGTSANVIPLLPLPLDVLRILTRGGDLPSDYSSATTPARVTAAKAEMVAALATLSSAYRPVETWTVEVLDAASPGEKYAYRKSLDSHLVAFYEADGDRYSLDQGMGLATGTRFSVTGYTDITGPTGFDGMELISLNVLFVPLASDSDADANLLGDDWEKFFFGSTGVVDPFGQHPVNGFTYLQLYLIGADPRSDDVPSVSPVVLFPGQTTIVSLTGGNYGLNFSFPDDYVDFFEFIVQESAVLNNFADLPGASTVTKIGVNTYQINVGPTASSGTENFFRLYLRLKNQ